MTTVRHLGDGRVTPVLFRDSWRLFRAPTLYEGGCNSPDEEKMMSVRYVLRPQIVNHQVKGRFRLVSLRSNMPQHGKRRMTATTGLVIAGAASLLLWLVILLVFA